MTTFKGIDLVARDRVHDAVIRFDRVNTAPTTTSGHRWLYVNSSDDLIFDDGSTTLNLSTVASGGATLDSAYDAGRTITVDLGPVTLTVSAAVDGLFINKTNTGAGEPLELANAGTADDILITNTRAGASGTIIDSYHQSASPADNDVIFELEANADDDAATKTEYGQLTFRALDVTDTTEDADFRIALMVAGTARTCLTIAGPTTTIGDGASNATLTTSGALDLILSTNAGTNSGTIRIFDGVNGNIEIETDGIGDLTLPATGIVQGGTTATRCTFAVGGTTGDGFLIATSTITSGDVLAIDHTASATLSGGNLLNLLVDSSSVFAVGETGAITMSGSEGTTVLAITAGDIVVSDGSLAITDDDNANSFAVTNNTATTASVIEIAGSGVFTGTGTSSFMEVSPSGLTTGTGIALTAVGLTSGNGMVITTNGQTSGISLTLTSTGTITGAGSMLSMIADSATTSTGLLRLTADALTTGYAVAVSSDSNEAMTSGRLADFVHSASGTTVAAKTGQLFSVTSSITESGTSTQDFDMMSFVRTSIHDTAGTLTTTGSVLYVENVTTETGATLTDSVNGVQIVMGSVGTGNAVSITHSGTTATVFNETANSINTGVGALFTLNGLTTGTGLRVTSSGTITTTGELVDIIGNSATTTTGLVRISGTALTDGAAINVTGGGANMTATGDLILASMGAATVGNGFDITTTGAYTGTGVILVTANTATTGDLVSISGTSLTTGNCILVTGGGAAITSGGQVIDVVMGAAIAGQGVRIATSGVYTGTTGILDINATAATTGVLASVDGTGLTTGTHYEALSTAATFTTGWYFRANDGGVNVFGVARNGHLAFRQTTLPTVVVTNQAGITAAAITTGSTDTVGVITTTGTSTGGTVITVTFNAAYAVAPRVFITPVNESAAENGASLECGAYISSSTTTTFALTITNATGATPSWNYYTVEMGS